MTPSEQPEQKPAVEPAPSTYREALMLAVSKTPHLLAALIVAYGVYDIVMTALPYCFGPPYPSLGG